MSKLSLYDGVQIVLLAIAITCLCVAVTSAIFGMNNFLQNNPLILIAMIVLLSILFSYIARRKNKQQLGT